MDAGFKKLVDSQFMTEAQAVYIENAVTQNENIIVSGHKGWGILPLLATIGNFAKQHFDVKQVKALNDLTDDVSYYVIAAPKENDFEALVVKAFSADKARTITIKDPDHPYSIMKVLKQIKKEDRPFCVVECAKVGDAKRCDNIKRMYFSTEGKIVKEDGPLY